MAQKETTMTDMQMPVPRPRPLWHIEDVAEYLGVPIKTLYKWRVERHGPPCARIGKHLRDMPEEVVAWVESCKQSDRFSVAASVWLKQLDQRVADGSRAPSSSEAYRRKLNRHVLAALGEV